MVGGRDTRSVSIVQCPITVKKVMNSLDKMTGHAKLTGHGQDSYHNVWVSVESSGNFH